MVHYILQTVAFQVFFLIIYDVFLKNETFFNWNRAYLIGTAFLSFILPFLKFESVRAIVPEPLIIRLPEVIIGEILPVTIDTSLSMQPEQISEQALSFSWTYVWIFGMTLTALILMYKMVKIWSMLFKNPQRWQGDALVVFLLNSSAAFSFFHYIFLGTNLDDKKKEHILQHEMVHVKEKHSLDLLVFEILRIVFWFNPFIYMYQGRIASLHEFIADSKAVKYRGKSEYYQNLLSQVFDTQKTSFINPFSHQSLIKKRIVMLSKSKSKHIHRLKYVVLAPVVMVMLMYTSSYAREIKDPFPFLQTQAVDQELSFQELVEKYYKEIIELKKSKHSFSKIHEGYLEPELMYIESKDKVAKRQAYMNYLFNEILSKKKQDGTLTEDIKDGYEKKRDRFKTYENYLAYKKTDEAKIKWEDKAGVGELRLVVDNMIKLTPTEEKRKAEKMALIEKDDFYYKLTITDGKRSSTTNFGKKITQVQNHTSIPENIEVPFSVIDEVPLYEGCEPSGSREDDKLCTSNHVSQFVNMNFNVDLATELGLTGKQRISVIFKIGKDGKIRDVMSRAPHPGLEAEAIRVIKAMPDFTPGKQKGKTVTVPYSLPILFQVQDPVKDLKKIDETVDDRTGVEKEGEERRMGDGENIEVPYAVVEEVPTFSSCKALSSNADRKECSSDYINQFINQNFNSKLAKELGLKGKQRLMVIFKIGKDGIISDIAARASHPDLEKEAVRVIKALPPMIPGKQRGKAVTVPYSLPILFQVQE